MDVEAAFLAALAGIDGYSLGGGRLELKKGDVVAVSFARVPGE